MDRALKEKLKLYILEKVKQSTSDDRPYFFVKWSGLFELCKIYGQDLLVLIDEMVAEGNLKKALIKGKLALYLPSVTVNTKAKKIKDEFENFLKLS
jgi:hypothetical protein